MSEPAELRFFDLGLAKGKEIGVTAERERIIAILNSYAPHLTTDGLMQQIKGEQK